MGKGRQNKKLEPSREKLIHLEETRQTLEQYLQEELNLELVQIPAAGSLLERAVSAVEQLRDVDRSRSETDLYRDLSKCFQEHLASLSVSGPEMKPCFEDTEIEHALRKRYVLTAQSRGRRVPIRVFSGDVADSIESQEQLIRESDR